MKQKDDLAATPYIHKPWYSLSDVGIPFSQGMNDVMLEQNGWLHCPAALQHELIGKDLYMHKFFRGLNKLHAEMVPTVVSHKFFNKHCIDRSGSSFHERLTSAFPAKRAAKILMHRLVFRQFESLKSIIEIDGEGRYCFIDLLDLDSEAISLKEVEACLEDDLGVNDALLGGAEHALFFSHLLTEEVSRQTFYVEIGALKPSANNEKSVELHLYGGLHWRHTTPEYASMVAAAILQNIRFFVFRKHKEEMTGINYNDLFKVFLHVPKGGPLDKHLEEFYSVEPTEKMTEDRLELRHFRLETHQIHDWQEIYRKVLWRRSLGEWGPIGGEGFYCPTSTLCGNCLGHAACASSRFERVRFSRLFNKVF